MTVARWVCYIATAWQHNPCTHLEQAREQAVSEGHVAALAALGQLEDHLAQREQAAVDVARLGLLVLGQRSLGALRACGHAGTADAVGLMELRFMPAKQHGCM